MTVPARHRKHELAQALRAGLSMYYTYILRSEADNKLYIGFCEDLRKRKGEHDNGLVEATKYRRPMTLIYYEACQSKEKAVNREKYFKTGFGRRFLKERI